MEFSIHYVGDSIPNYGIFSQIKSYPFYLIESLILSSILPTNLLRCSQISVSTSSSLIFHLKSFFAENTLQLLKIKMLSKIFNFESLFEFHEYSL